MLFRHILNARLGGCSAVFIRSCREESMEEAKEARVWFYLNYWSLHPDSRVSLTFRLENLLGKAMWASVAVRFRRNTGGRGVLIIMALSCAPCKKYTRNSHVTAVWEGCRDSLFFFRGVRFWLSPRILDLSILFSNANRSHCSFDHNSHELNASIYRRFSKVHRHFGVRFFHITQPLASAKEEWILCAAF